MALKSFRCTKCDEDCKYGDWDCQGGGRHEVAPKAYYSAAASWRTYTSEEKVQQTGDGRTRIVPARPVQFNKGVFNTTDPEDQYTLDSHKGLITVEQWREKFIPKEERLAMKEREIAAREERLVKHEQSLLDQAKAQTQPEPEPVGGEKRGKK